MEVKEMPNAVTHSYFVRDVYKRLNPKVRRKIDLDFLVTFGVGPDAFYNPSFTSFPFKKIRNFGYQVHHKKTQKFLIEYVDHILKYRLENNREIISSLFGMLCHNVLDKTTHPLIYYQTGGNAIKHREMELLIDLYMLEKREQINPRRVRIAPLLFPKMKFSVQLRNLLDRVYEDTYGKRNMGKTYLKCLNQMKRNYQYFRYDPMGYKLKLYHTISKFPWVSKKMNYYSYANNLRKKVSYINFKHNGWSHPCNKKEICTDSFFDLYKKAILEAVYVIEETYDVLSKDKELRNLRSVIDNRSMITGKDCNSKTQMKYFKNQIINQ